VVFFVLFLRKVVLPEKKGFSEGEIFVGKPALAGFCCIRPFCSATVKGLSRHNGAPPPLFHDPLDSLAFLRVKALPITGNQTEQTVSRSSVFYCTQEGRFTT